MEKWKTDKTNTINLVDMKQTLIFILVVLFNIVINPIIFNFISSEFISSLAAFLYKKISFLNEHHLVMFDGLLKAVALALMVNIFFVLVVEYAVIKICKIKLPNIFAIFLTTIVIQLIIFLMLWIM